MSSGDLDFTVNIEGIVSRRLQYVCIGVTIAQIVVINSGMVLAEAHDLPTKRRIEPIMSSPIVNKYRKGTLKSTFHRSSL